MVCIITETETPFAMVFLGCNCSPFRKIPLLFISQFSSENLTSGVFRPPCVGVAKSNVKATSAREDNGDHDNAHHRICLMIRRQRKGRNYIMLPKTCVMMMHFAYPNIQAPSLKCRFFLEHSSLGTRNSWCAHVPGRNGHPVMINHGARQLDRYRKSLVFQVRRIFFRSDWFRIGLNMQYCLQIKNRFFSRAVPGDTSDESVCEHIDFC